MCLLISLLPFCLSLLSAAHTVRWWAQPWAATVKAVHFATTTCVLWKQVSGCIKYRHNVKNVMISFPIMDLCAYLKHNNFSYSLSVFQIAL